MHDTVLERWSCTHANLRAPLKRSFGNIYVIKKIIQFPYFSIFAGNGKGGKNSSHYSVSCN